MQNYETKMLIKQIHQDAVLWKRCEYIAYRLITGGDKRNQIDPRLNYKLAGEIYASQQLLGPLAAKVRAQVAEANPEHEVGRINWTFVAKYLVRARNQAYLRWKAGQ